MHDDDYVGLMRFALARTSSSLKVLPLVAVLAGCASGVTEDTSFESRSDLGKTADEWVVQSTFAKAHSIVSGIDYLPFDFLVDGCYARALYMSMELAAEGLESNEVFAFARWGSSLKVGDIEWSYHVAPMLYVGADEPSAVRMIIDPGMSDEPLTQDEWLTKMGVNVKGPASALPRLLSVPGSNYAPDDALADVEHHDKDVPSFASMPAFESDDIQDACGVMHAYLAREPESTKAEASAKRKKLLARTATLVSKLEKSGKLVVKRPFSKTECAEYFVPWF